MSSGIRCAETTSASYGTSNSPSAWAAALIVGQSESEPITIPASGPASLIAGSHQVGGCVPGPATHVVQVAPECRHVADLAARPNLLAIQLDPKPRVAGEAVQQGRRKIIHRAAKD